MGLWTEVILWEGDKPKIDPHFHKITSVDLCHNIPSLHNPSVPTPCLNLKNKSHPVKSALARTLGVSVPKLVTVGMHFRIESENAPPSLEESRETFLARKVSRAAFLWYLSFAEAKESTPKANRYSRNHISAKFQTQTNFSQTSKRPTQNESAFLR